MKRAGEQHSPALVGICVELVKGKEPLGMQLASTEGNLTRYGWPRFRRLPEVTLVVEGGTVDALPAKPIRAGDLIACINGVACQDYPDTHKSLIGLQSGPLRLYILRPPPPKTTLAPTSTPAAPGKPTPEESRSTAQHIVKTVFQSAEKVVEEQHSGGLVDTEVVIGVVPDAAPASARAPPPAAAPSPKRRRGAVAASPKRGLGRGASAASSPALQALANTSASKRRRR